MGTAADLESVGDAAGRNACLPAQCAGCDLVSPKAGGASASISWDQRWRRVAHQRRRNGHRGANRQPGGLLWAAGGGLLMVASWPGARPINVAARSRQSHGVRMPRPW